MEQNKKKLFVASLSFRMRDDDLQEIFSSVGNVVNAKVVIDRDGRSRGYGFVEMETEDEADNAINKLNKTIHFNREIVVQAQKPKEQNL